jgi:transposase
VNIAADSDGAQHSGKAVRAVWFCCKRCGLAGPADIIAAVNISGRAAVMQPNAA